MREHCWNNRPPKSPGYWVHVRNYRPDGSYTMGDKFIKDVMSEPCGQPGKELPPAEGCVGCRFLGSP